MNATEARLSPSQIGARLDPPVDARTVNVWLEQAGYQERDGASWRLLAKGRPHGVEEQSRGPGANRAWIRWSPDILALLLPFASTEGPRKRRRCGRAPSQDYWSRDGRPLLFIDTESTGPITDPGNPKCNDTIQLAAIVLDGGTLKELGAFSSWIRPCRPWNENPYATRVHGRSMASLLGEPAPRDVLQRFEAFLLGPSRALSTREDVCRLARSRFDVAAHNAGHDARYIGLLYQAVALPVDRLGDSWLCTQRMAERLIRDQALETPGSKPGLDALLAGLGMPPRTGCHNALHDVRQTASVFRRMAELDGWLACPDLQSAEV